MVRKSEVKVPFQENDDLHRCFAVSVAGPDRNAYLEEKSKQGNIECMSQAHDVQRKDHRRERSKDYEGQAILPKYCICSCSPDN